MKKTEIKRLESDIGGALETDNVISIEVKRTDSDGETETDDEIVIDRELEEKYLKQLDIDPSGFLIYPGSAPISQRKGSQALDLIRWHLYKNSHIKPVDYTLFKDLVSKMIIN
jgi:hypothetical protein